MAEPALVWLFCIGLFVTFVTAIALKALHEVAWHELQEYCRSRNKDDLFNEIHEKSEYASLAIESMQIVSVLFTTIIGVDLYLERFPADHLTGHDLLPLLIGGTITYFAVTIWVPREIAAWFGAAFLCRTWSVWRLVTWLFTPLGWLSRALEIAFHRASGESEEKARERELEDEIRSLVVEGQHDKSLPGILREMIEGVINLDDRTARDIMRHRSEIDSVNIESSYRDVLRQVILCGRTRLPVYEKNLDHVLGTLYVKDLLKAFAEDRTIHDLREILRPHYEVPETVPLHELLRQFLHDKAHQAIVIDEFNSTIGLVTIEDILEEIVGEITDESEVAEEAEITRLSEETVSILADTHIDDVNEQLAINLPLDGDFSTLGGFVIAQLREIPKPGRQFDWNGCSFYVEEASARQIKRIRLQLPLNRPATQEAAEDAEQIVRVS